MFWHRLKNILPSLCWLNPCGRRQLKGEYGKNICKTWGRQAPAKVLEISLFTLWRYLNFKGRSKNVFQREEARRNYSYSEYSGAIENESGEEKRIFAIVPNGSLGYSQNRYATTYVSLTTQQRMLSGWKVRWKKRRVREANRAASPSQSFRERHSSNANTEIIISEEFWCGSDTRIIWE